MWSMAPSLGGSLVDDEDKFESEPYHGDGRDADSGADSTTLEFLLERLAEWCVRALISCRVAVIT
jgi:hypothetical protein